MRSRQKRAEIKENDIPDIIERYHNIENETDRERTEKSFFVPKDEIVSNDYDLSINKYKKTEYVPIEYPSTEEIMAKRKEIEELVGKKVYLELWVRVEDDWRNRPGQLKKFGYFNLDE